MKGTAGGRHGQRLLAALAIAALALGGACGDDGEDDLMPSEPEAGEEDTEIVPGEGGPVD